MATLARELCDLHRRLNSDLLLTAAIVHDIGRTREFTYGAEIGLTEEGRLLGHLTLGQQLLSERFAALGEPLDEPRRLALLHCVLSPPWSGGRAGRPLRLAGGAGALPAQRARRGRQGRARARTRPSSGLSWPEHPIKQRRRRHEQAQRPPPRAAARPWRDISGRLVESTAENATVAAIETIVPRASAAAPAAPL